MLLLSPLTLQAMLDEKDEEGMWDEMFKSFTDTKPNGNCQIVVVSQSTIYTGTHTHTKVINKKSN